MFAANSSAGFKRIGIYVHIPFCERKCFYCDFYSVEDHSRRDEFIDSLVREIGLFSSDRIGHSVVDTVFFGGGTPSLLSSEEIGLVLEAIQSRFEFSLDVEFTIECNPGTVSQGSLASYRRIGINRLSFGVQSFFDDELRFLSRIHDSRQAAEAITLAHKCGFENVNLDLMYGLPGQSIERVMSNLNRAVELNPEHISAYNLIVEPNTPLFASVASGNIEPQNELTQASMYELTMSFLGEKGYEHYEISNYSRSRFRCRHNLKYWDCKEYVGFGPSAHSYMNGTRWWNISSLNKYLFELSEGRLPISAKEELSESDLADEFVMLQLRQGKLELNTLSERFKIDLDAEFISDLVRSGYAVVSSNRLTLTNKGFTVCDEIAERCLSRPTDIQEDPCQLQSR
jgi:oxygen-independent coproporphyrinogen-3 oxidase